jgi:hypothetical protein
MYLITEEERKILLQALNRAYNTLYSAVTDGVEGADEERASYDSAEDALIAREKLATVLTPQELSLVLKLVEAAAYYRYLTPEELELQKKLGGKDYQRGEK